MRYADGVLMAGDRLATEGHRVASRDLQKVYPTDAHSLVAIAGAAGPAIEMARMLRIELEHYEKIEGEALELEGKANKLSQMVRANLPAAMQGLVVVPIFAGYDLRRRIGRLWKYDVTGGRYEEPSTSVGHRQPLRPRVDQVGLDRRHDARRHRRARQPLAFAAADEDLATGGVDLARGIFPLVAAIDGNGFRRLDDADVEQRSRALLDGPERGGEST